MQVNYSYVRSHKKLDLQNRYARFKRKDELNVLECNDSTILPLRKFAGDDLLFGRGGVIDNQKKYLSESAIPGRVEGKYEFDVAVKKNETAVYCGFLVGHWGHFLIEAVSRLWFVLENNSIADKYVFIVESDSMRQPTGNFKEFFEILGIAEKIEIINQPTEYKKVFIPEISYKYNQSYSIRYRNIFDVVIQNVMEKYKNSQCFEKVFLSRSKFKKAQIAEAGLDLLDNYFEKNGYKVLYPEQLTLSELIWFLQNSKECAAESGTTPHNILFGYSGQKLIIVERQTVVNPVQTNIDTICNLNVTYIDGHYTIYPVSQGGGPYILAYNEQFKKFTQDNNYLPPDQKYLKSCYIQKCLRQYMREYKNEYYYSWGLEDWAIQYAETIFEAYNESKEDLKQYLLGINAFKISQIFELRFLKKFVRKVVRR